MLPVNQIRQGFTDYIRLYGDQAKIIHHTPQKIDGKVIKDDRGHTVYNKEEINIQCRVKLLKGDERVIQSGLMEEGDAVGLFQLKDSQYIHERNELILTQQENYGETYHYRFRLTKPVYKKTHITSKLRRLEI